MGLNFAQKLIKSHLLSSAITVGKKIGMRIDQTLAQNATGTLVMLELESMGLDSARTELSCQYVDHNLIQEDHKNPDDHLPSECMSAVRDLV
jgi:aconitate hydratase